MTVQVKSILTATYCVFISVFHISFFCPFPAFICNFFLYLILPPPLFSARDIPLQRGHHVHQQLVPSFCSPPLHRLHPLLQGKLTKGPCVAARAPILQSFCLFYCLCSDVSCDWRCWFSVCPPLHWFYDCEHNFLGTSCRGFFYFLSHWAQSTWSINKLHFWRIYSLALCTCVHVLYLRNASSLNMLLYECLPAVNNRFR